MSARGRSGFTITEVLIAVVMLCVGAMALASSSAMVSRMIGRGKTSTFAGQMATARVERLRQIAGSTANPCTSPEWRTDSTGPSAANGHVGEKWEILDNAGNSRRVRVTVQYAVTRGVAVDTMVTRVLCK